MSDRQSGRPSGSSSSFAAAGRASSGAALACPALVCSSGYLSGSQVIVLPLQFLIFLWVLHLCLWLLIFGYTFPKLSYFYYNYLILYFGSLHPSSASFFRLSFLLLFSSPSFLYIFFIPHKSSSSICLFYPSALLLSSIHFSHLQLTYCLFWFSLIRNYHLFPRSSFISIYPHLHRFLPTLLILHSDLRSATHLFWLSISEPFSFFFFSLFFLFYVFINLFACLYAHVP